MDFRFTDSVGGKSTGVYLSRNLALHVGDQSTSVELNRLELGVEIDRPIQFMDQIHGDHLEVIEEICATAPTADALLTSNPDIALAVMVADCIPLLLSNQGCIAAVHVGRKGLLNQVAKKTLVAMSEIDPSQITAIIGPAICGSCYEVSEDIFNEVTSVFPLSRSQTVSGGFALDLVAALSFELQDSGVTILDRTRCTAEDRSLYSYRRDGNTGRQAGLIWL